MYTYVYIQCMLIYLCLHYTSSFSAQRLLNLPIVPRVLLISQQSPVPGPTAMAIALPGTVGQRLLAGGGAVWQPLRALRRSFAFFFFGGYNRHFRGVYTKYTWCIIIHVLFSIFVRWTRQDVDQFWEYCRSLIGIGKQRIAIHSTSHFCRGIFIFCQNLPVKNGTSTKWSFKNLFVGKLKTNPPDQFLVTYWSVLPGQSPFAVPLAERLSQDFGFYVIKPNEAALQN